MHSGPFSCARCEKSFSCFASLRSHQVEKVCFDRQDRAQSDVDGFLISHSAQGQIVTPLYFKCPICKQLHHHWCQYVLHLQHANNSMTRQQKRGVTAQFGRPFSCSHCDLEFRFLGSYIDHLREHAAQTPYACPLCPVTFTDFKNFAVHISECHKQHSYKKCNTCGKIFSTLRNTSCFTKVETHISASLVTSHSPVAVP